MRISDWSSDVCSSDLVTFTGSTAVGRHIAGVCGDRIARVALELGGKSAAIILDDMPIDDVVTKLLPASTTLSGQACSALTRVILPRHRHDDFVDAFAVAPRSAAVGAPFHPPTDLGTPHPPRAPDRPAPFTP